ncbi:hypothetical protein K439DRAFT_413020 [Ramaria rubella]|nr:hypothetical protein K439DRAFT_413020 [Ramaria rubella]
MELTSFPWNFSWYTLNATTLPVRLRPHMWGPDLTGFQMDAVQASGSHEFTVEAHTPMHERSFRLLHGISRVKETMSTEYRVTLMNSTDHETARASQV